MDDRVRVATFEAAPTSAAEARSFVADVLRDFGLTALVADAVLVVSELATNAVRHAHTAFSVTVDCRAGGGALLSLRDGSPHHPIPVTAGQLDEAGRGLALVQLLSNDWGVSTQPDGGKSVWVRLGTDPGRMVGERGG